MNQGLKHPTITNWYYDLGKVCRFLSRKCIEKMRNFIESEECDKILSFLRTESKRDKRIAPLSHNVLDAWPFNGLF